MRLVHIRGAEADVGKVRGEQNYSGKMWGCPHNYCRRMTGKLNYWRQMRWGTELLADEGGTELLWADEGAWNLWG